MLNEVDEESKIIRIKNADLLYPFALLLFMLLFSDLIAYLSVIIFLTFGAPILGILFEIFPEIDDSSMNIIINIIINLISQTASVVIFVLLYQIKKVEPEEKSMPPGSHSITLLVIYSMLALFTFSIAFLFILFPFEFIHFADMAPKSIRFLVRWISNDIARVIMILLLFGHLAAAIYSPIAYKFIDKKRSMLKKATD